MLISQALLMVELLILKLHKNIIYQVDELLNDCYDMRHGNNTWINCVL